MPCTQYEDLIIEYCEGALGEEERCRLDAHLCECPECRSFFEMQHELDRTLSRSIGKPAPSPCFRQNLMHRIDAECRPRFGWVPLALDVIGYSSVAAVGGLVLSVLVPADYAGWALVAAYAAAGMGLGIFILRSGRLPGQR